MRLDVYVPTKSVEDQLQFYLNELALFRVKHDYGMGAVLLCHIDEPNVCIELAPGVEPRTNCPLMSLSVSDCEAEFRRLSGVAFSKGGMHTPAGPSRLLDYPLGKSFSVTDASGNLIVIAEWHPNAA